MGSGDQADPGRPDEAAFAGLEDEAATSYAPRAWQRAYLGYKERFVDDAYLKLRGGSVSLCIRQAPSAKALPATAANSRKGGGKAAAASVSPSDGDRGSDPALTATTLWDGAIVLAQLLTATDVLAQHAGSWPSGGRLPRCIELGAGTGAVSLALMACRCVESATVTDLPGALEHIRTNVLRNNRHVDPSRVHVRPLRWGSAEDVAALSAAPAASALYSSSSSSSSSASPSGPPFDLVVGSDLIYYSYSPETPHSLLLLDTLTALTCQSSVIYLVLGLQHNPNEVAHFLGAARGRGFAVQRLSSSVPEEFRVPDSLAMRLTRNGS